MCVINLVQYNSGNVLFLLKLYPNLPFLSRGRSFKESYMNFVHFLRTLNLNTVAVQRLI